VLTLLVVVIVAIVGLIPGQSTTALGLELLGIGGAFAIVVARLSRNSAPPPGVTPRAWLVRRLAIQALLLGPLAIGSISLLAESGGGLYWVVAALVWAIIAAVANAWVLLVEILR
jgi:hypothetical protein